MTKVIAEKNAIKKQLMKEGMVLHHDVGSIGSEEFQDAVSTAAIAGLIFDAIDNSGNGSVTYSQLRRGLVDYHVYLSKKEFRGIAEFLDPDLNGQIERREWMVQTPQRCRHIII